MDFGTLGALVTIVAFGCLGLNLAYRRSQPLGKWLVGLLGVGALVGVFVGASTRLLDAFGFLMPLNWAIVSGSLGAILGSLLRGSSSGRIKSS